MAETMGEKKEVIKIMEFENGRNIVHIPIRTPEEEAKHQEEMNRAVARFMKAVLQTKEGDKSCIK